MPISESWIGKSLERKYTTTILFDDPSLWDPEAYPVTWHADVHNMAWKTLELLDMANMFHLRIVRRQGSRSPAAFYQVIIHRNGLGNKFGEGAIVGVQLQVFCEDIRLNEKETLAVTWFYDPPSSTPVEPRRIKEDLNAAGYQEYHIPLAPLLDLNEFLTAPKFTVSLEIKIRTKGYDDALTKSKSRQGEFVRNMTKMLGNPNSGNVEFVFPHTQGVVPEHPPPRLFTFRHIFLNCRGAYANGEPVGSDKVPDYDTPPPSPTSPSREAIFVDEDIELFRLILVYLYTEQITFVDCTEIVNDNTTHDAEAVYAIARRLQVHELQQKAAHFLKATTNLENISERTFGRFALQHEELGLWYDKFFIDHWDDLKSRRKHEFMKVFTDLRGNFEEYLRVTTKFLDMIIHRD